MLAYIRKVAEVRKDEGASAVEYGLLVAAIAALIVIIVFALGGVTGRLQEHLLGHQERRPSNTSTSC